MEMTASGTRTAVHYLNPDGTLASAHGTDSGDLTITIPAVGQSVPVKQSGSLLHHFAAPSQTLEDVVRFPAQLLDAPNRRILSSRERLDCRSRSIRSTAPTLMRLSVLRSR